MRLRAQLVARWGALGERLGPRGAARLVAIAAAVLQILLVAHIFLSPGEVAGDDMSIHTAEIAGIARSLGGGHVDLWNPSANGGFASAYYYQFLPQLVVALFYLALGWLVSLSLLVKLAIAASLAALPLTTYRGLRVIGLEPPAAAFGGLAASLVSATSVWGSGVDSLFASGLFTQQFALALFPLAAAYAGRFLVRGEGLGRALGYTLLCGYCHPVVAVALLPALCAAPWWRLEPRVLAARAGALFALALAGSAPLWLPIVVHYDSFGGFPARVAGEDGIAAGDLAVSLARGELLDRGRLPVITALALLAVAVAASRRGRALAPVLGAGAVFAALLAVGPMIGKTRGDLLPAVRFLGPMQLCFAAAAGAAAATAARLAWRRAARPLPRALLAVGCCALVAVAVDGARRRAADQVRTIDDFRGQHPRELAAIIDYLASRPRGRVYASSEIGTGSHWWMYLPSAYADRPAVRAYGGAALQSSPEFVYLRAFDLGRHWRLWAVRYLLVEDGKPIPDGIPFEVAFTTEHYRVLELPETPLVSAVRPGGTLAAGREARADQVVAWMRRHRPGGRRVLVSGPDPGPVAPPATVKVTRVASARASHAADVEVPGSRPALIRLAVSVHPGWRATVDGAPAAIRRVGPAMMAVLVPPGRHRLRFEFSRPGWTWIPYGLLLLAIGLWIAAGRRRRGVGLAALALFVAAGSGDAAAQPRPAQTHPVDLALDRDGRGAAVSTGSGIWIRSLPGGPFEYVCPEVAGTEAGAFDPRVAIDRGRVFVASHRGLRVGDRCGLEPATFSDAPGARPRVSLWIASVAVASDGTIWAASADGIRSNDVYAARPGAPAHFESVGLHSDRRWYLSALPAPSAPRTAYVSSYQVAPARAALYRVGPGGPVELSQAGLRLGRSRRSRFLAVDPDDATIAFLSAEAVTEPRGDRLYRLAGDRFTAVLDPGGPITGVVSRGAEVWAAARAPCRGETQPGCLYRSRDRGVHWGGGVPTPELACLVDSGDALLGCRADADTSGVALVAIDGRGAARPALRTADVAPPCTSCAERCRGAWERTCRELGADCDAPALPSLDRVPPRPQRRWPWLAAILLPLAAVPWLLRRRPMGAKSRRS